MDNLDEKKNELQILIKAIDRVQKGEEINTICKENNINQGWFVNFLKREELYELYENDNYHPPVSKNKIEFIHKVLGEEYYPLDDFDEAFRIVSDSLLMREKKVLEKHLFEEKTLREIGEDMGLTGSRIQQIQQDAIDRCKRSRTLQMYFKYGVKDTKKIGKTEQEVESYTKAIDELLEKKSLLEKIYIDRVKSLEESKKNLEEIVNLTKNNASMLFSNCENMEERLKELNNNWIEIPEKNIESDSIDILELSLRAKNILQRAGILTIHDLLKSTPTKLRTIKNMGKKSYAEILKKMQDLGYEEWCILFSNSY